MSAFALPSGMAFGSWREPPRRLTRLAFALLILAVHVLALHMLLTLRQSPPVPPRELRSFTFIVIPSKPEVAAPQTGATPPLATSKPNIIPPPQSLPPLALPETPPVSDTQVPAQALLRQYLGCRLPGAGEQMTEDRERCAKMQRDLPAGALSPERETEAERQLALKFQHEKAIDDAAILLPCAGGGMINPICVISGILNGFDFSMDSYANPHPSVEPAPIHGMVDKSGHVPDLK